MFENHTVALHAQVFDLHTHEAKHRALEWIKANLGNTSGFSAAFPEATGLTAPLLKRRPADSFQPTTGHVYRGHTIDTWATTDDQPGQWTGHFRAAKDLGTLHFETLTSLVQTSGLAENLALMQGKTWIDNALKEH